MPEYKDIVYSENTQTANVIDSAYAQAVSAGDKLEEIRYMTPIVCVSEADVMEKFPSPKQFDKVFRTDTACQYVYYEVYNKANNPLGRPLAGWYPISDAMIPIYDQTAYADGDSPLNKVSALGKLTFDNVYQVFFMNCFTPQFNFYRFVINVWDVDVTGAPYLQLRSGGNPITAATYNQQHIQIARGDTGPSSAFVSNGIKWDLDSGSRNFRVEGYMYVKQNEPVKILWFFAGGDFGSSTRIRYGSGAFNPGSTIIDGLKFATPAANQLMSGTIQIWGLRNAI